MKEDDPLSLLSLWQTIGGNLQILAIAGIGGALIKSLLAPEADWKRRISQAVAGILTAIFLGGFIADFAARMFPTADPHYLLLAVGAVCAFGGEAIVSFAQNKILGVKK